MLLWSLKQAPQLLWLTGLVLGLSCCYLAYRVIYNLCLHPLRHYPGPWYRAASRLPYTTTIFRGNATHRVATLHERYGEVVRIAPDALSYATAEAWPDIYGNKQSNGRGNLRKDPKSYVRYDHVAEISTALDADHRRLRRVQSYAFSTKALELQKTVLQRYTEKFITRLREQASKSHGIIDISTWINCLTVDLIGALSFSEDFGNLDTGKLNPRLEMIFTSIKHFSVVKEILQLPWFLSRIFGVVMSAIMLGQRSRVSDIGADVMAKRRKKHVESTDIAFYMLRQGDTKGGGMTSEEVDKAATTFIIAGSETTATLLSGAIYLLLSHRDALAKLTWAIRADFECKEDFTYSKLEHHEYLNAVLQESLRLYPPAPDMLYRSTMEEPAIVAGRTVPPHTSVTMNIWAANRSTSNFHRPEEFLPERWLSERPAMFERDERSALNPFSTGPRNCIGMNLAWIEMRMALAWLLFEFDLIEVEQSSKGWIDRQKIFFLWEKLPLLIRINPRSSG